MNSIKMRRNNKILLGLLAMLLVMSTGYALFSKEITIGGNVTAKGSFNIGLTCTKGMNSDVISALAAAEGESASEYIAMFNSMQHGYTTDNCTVSGTAVTTSTALSYPGSNRYYTIEVKNSGDIPAKWHYEDGFSGTYTLCGGSNASSCETANSSDSNELNFSYLSDTLFERYPSIRHYAKKSSSGTYTSIVGLDIEEVADSEGYIYLEPGESLFFVASNTWWHWLSGDEYNNAYGNYQTFKFEFDFNFEQATE